MTTVRSHQSMLVRHESGATHELRGRAFKKLRKELLAGRGGPEVTRLVENGYTAYSADDGQEYDLSELSSATFAPKEG